MKNSANVLRIEKQELGYFSKPFESTNVVERKNGMIKSRLGIIYFVAVVSSLIVLFLK